LRSHHEPDARLLDIRTTTKDAQTELVRRYQRILRSAPAEAVRARTPATGAGPPRFTRSDARPRP
jgi:hypothetical protein